MTKGIWRMPYRTEFGTVHVDARWARRNGGPLEVFVAPPGASPYDPYLWRPAAEI